MKFVIHFLFLAVAIAWLYRRGAEYYWQALAWFFGGIAANSRLRLLPARRRVGGVQPRLGVRAAAHRRRQQDQHLRRGRGLERLPGQRPQRRPEPPRDHAARPAARAHAALPPARERTPAAHAHRRADRVPARVRARDAVAQRPARPRRRRADPAAPVPPLPPHEALALSAGGRARRDRGVRDRALALRRRRVPLAHADGRQLDERAPAGLRLHPADPPLAPAVRPRLQHVLGLLRAGDRQDELGPALVLRAAADRVGARRDGAVRGLPRLGVHAAAVGPPHGRRARPRRRSARPPPDVRSRGA